MPSKLQLPLGQSQSPLIPAAALLAAMVSLQVGASFAKELFPAVGAEGATVLRLGFAALLLMVVMRPWRVRFDAADWRWLVAYGLAIGGMNLLFYMAIATLPLGIGTALMFAGPLTAALLSSRRLADFLWVGLAVGGLLLLLPIFNGDAADDPRGLALALGAGGCWVLYIFAGKRAGGQHGPQAAALGMAIAACAVLPIGGSAEWSALSAGLLLTALLVAILSSAVPFTLEMVALKRLPTATFSTMTSMEPAVAALVGLLVLGEQLSVTQWLALSAIIIASVGTTMTIRPAAASLPD